MQRLRRYLMIIGMLVLFAVNAVLAADKTPDQLLKEAQAVITQVSVADVKKMMDNKEKVIFLDVRDKEEFDAGHLPGAINMSRGLLDFHIQEIIPDKTAKVVVH